MRFLIVAALFGLFVYGEDFALPLDGGHILIGDPVLHLIKNASGTVVPKLMFKLTNETSSPWRLLKLQFEIAGSCNGESPRWTLPIVASLGWSADHEITRDFSEYEIFMVGKVDGCTAADTIKASLLVAESLTTRIDCAAGEAVVLADNFRSSIDCVTDSEAKAQERLQKLKTKRDAEAAADAEAELRQAEDDRRAAQEQAKKDAAEAARRKRLAAEQKKKQAEEDAKYAAMKAEEYAKAAEERRKLRAACTTIYQNTIDKKVRDLTVREEQQVRTCQAMGLYPPP